MSSSSSCYLGSNNIIQLLPNFGPCQAGNTTNPYVSCWCVFPTSVNTTPLDWFTDNSYSAVGHVCLSNGFCQYSPIPPNGSGIYTGGCTDSSLQDGSCASFCKALPGSEIIFVDGAWQCCGQDINLQATCKNPQGPSFSDPSPFDLTKVAVIEGSSTPTAYSLFPTGIAALTSGSRVAAIGTVLPSGSTIRSVVGTSAATSTATQVSLISAATATSTPSDAASTSSSTPISSGAIAGIVVGVVGLVALVGVLAWLLCIAKRRSRHNNEQSRSLSTGHPETTKGSASSYGTYQPGYSHGASRSAVTIASEMEAKSPLSSHPTSAPSPSSPHGNVVYEMQSPVTGRYHELDSQSHPSELMDCIRDEDRTVGGGPDKRLPSLPSTTPQNVRSTQRSSYLGRYQHLLGRK